MAESDKREAAGHRHRSGRCNRALMLMAILKTTTWDKKASHDGPVWPTEEGADNPRPEEVGPIGAILWWNAVVLIMEAAAETHSSSELHGT